MILSFNTTILSTKTNLSLFSQIFSNRNKFIKLILDIIINGQTGLCNIIEIKRLS